MVETITAPTKDHNVARNAVDFRELTPPTKSDVPQKMLDKNARTTPAMFPNYPRQQTTTAGSPKKVPRRRQLWVLRRRGHFLRRRGLGSLASVGHPCVAWLDEEHRDDAANE